MRAPGDLQGGEGRARKDMAFRWLWNRILAEDGWRQLGPWLRGRRYALGLGSPGRGTHIPQGGGSAPALQSPTLAKWEGESRDCGTWGRRWTPPGLCQIQPATLAAGENIERPPCLPAFQRIGSPSSDFCLSLILLASESGHLNHPISPFLPTSNSSFQRSVT